LDFHDIYLSIPTMVITVRHLSFFDLMRGTGVKPKRRESLFECFSSLWQSRSFEERRMVS
jgi:hypothetical protein